MEFGHNINRLMKPRVIPTKAGTQSLHKQRAKLAEFGPVWVPAFAGMTNQFIAPLPLVTPTPTKAFDPAPGFRHGMQQRTKESLH
jgi:hypothetical protein